MHPGDQVCIGRSLWRVRCPKSGSTDPITRYGDSVKETAGRGSRKLLIHMTDSCTVHSATEKIFSIDKDGMPIPVTLDQMAEMPKVFSCAEPTAGL